MTAEERALPSAAPFEFTKGGRRKAAMNSQSKKPVKSPIMSVTSCCSPPMLANQNSMDTIATKTCSAFNHPEIILEFDGKQVLDSDAKWFANGLEAMVRDGSRFLPGQSLQLGWSLVWFTSLPGGALGFEEPDMSSIPIIRQSGLTNSLRHLRLQKDSLESVLPAETLAFPSLRQTCIVCTNLARSESFLMERQASKGADSGWFIGCDEKAHNHNTVSNLSRVSIYEAAVKLCPRSLPYLGFPDGSAIIFDHAPHFLWDGDALELRPRSFLDQLRKNMLVNAALDQVTGVD